MFALRNLMPKQEKIIFLKRNDKQASHIVLCLDKRQLPSLKTRIEDLYALGYENILLKLPDEELTGKEMSIICENKEEEPVQQQQELSVMIIGDMFPNVHQERY